MQAPCTMLSQTTLLIGKPGYLINLLKPRAILSQVITSDAILLDVGTTRSVFRYRAFSSVVPRTCNILPYELRKYQSYY